MSDALRLGVLFDGRRDCYGAGGDRPRCVKEPLTHEVWERHLASGMYPVGVYPRTDEDLVHWGCSDLDKGYEAINSAFNIQEALGTLGLASFVEITRSKGYHVWAFLPADVWVPAAAMRNTFLLAHNLADEDPREVNPKQVTGGLGNYVRVPYPEYGAQGRQIVFRPGTDHPLGLRDFLDLGEANGNLPAAVKEASEIWLRFKPPAPVVEVVITPYDGKLDHLVNKLPKRAQLRFEEPLPNEELGRIDRSHELFCVVLDARDAGLLPGQALSLLHDAHARWGGYKYEGREYELENMVTHAYRSA